MQKIFETQNKVILYLLKSKLEDQAIDTFIKNEMPPAAGEIPPAIVMPELWVIQDENYAEALRIIEIQLSQLSQIQQTWICPHCGEKLEGQFDVCWKCGSSKP